MADTEQDRSVYLVVDPSVEGYTPTLAAYRSRDEARADLRALVTMSREGCVEIRRFEGRLRLTTWLVTLDVAGDLSIVILRRRG